MDGKGRKQIVDQLSLGLGSQPLAPVFWKQRDANLDSPEATRSPVDPPDACPVVQGHSEEGLLADQTVLLPSVLELPQSISSVAEPFELTARCRIDQQSPQKRKVIGLDQP